MCKEPKALDEFGKNRCKKDGYQNYCKVCNRAYNSEHYRRSPDRRRKLRETSVRAKAVNRKIIIDAKSGGVYSLF